MPTKADRPRACLHVAAPICALRFIADIHARDANATTPPSRNNTAKIGPPINRSEQERERHRFWIVKAVRCHMPFPQQRHDVIITGMSPRGKTPIEPPFPAKASIFRGGERGAIWPLAPG